MLGTCGTRAWLVLGVFLAAGPMAAWAADVTVDVSAAGRKQIIDGFGSHQGGSDMSQATWRNLYFDDMGCSMLRVDLTPSFKSPYSDYQYVSPWYGQAAPLNLPGPDGNNVRTYTSASDYTRTFGGRSAPIAVMGPDIDVNCQYFSFASGTQNSYDGPVALLAKTRAKEPNEFKLTGSIWSPEPWVKISSGNTYPSGSGSGYPTAGTPWPFIWGGNFAGGKLDVSDTPMAVFDDSSMGGTGPTSALTQFARSSAAYLRAYQNHYGIKFYAISIQNELNFEEFYNSMTYPLSSQYIAALKKFRAELDKYPDLASIKLIGPEDLMGGDAWGMWQLGGDTDKNLRYLQNLGADSAALNCLSHFAIHGYADNGTSSAGASPTEWGWWANGWTTSPASGIPANVKGFTYYTKSDGSHFRSWMTETSGENAAWLSPSSGFPSDGAWSIALKLHQALTVGQESAWEYWTFYSSSTTDQYALVGGSLGANSPKYVAAKHYFRYIRPNAQAVNCNVTGSTTMLASAYIHDTSKTLTVVYVNESATAENAVLHVPASPAGILSFSTFTSSNGSYWQSSTTPVTGGTATVSVPGYGVVTLYGVSTVPPPDKPVNVSPADTATGIGLTPMLAASAFHDSDGSVTHLASQWQLREAASPTSYSVVLFDSGTTSALTSAAVPALCLDGNTAYAWRVRYQHSLGSWSAWSDETTFTTAPAPPVNHPPDKPINLVPADGATAVALPTTMTASAFSDRNASDTHAASQWQARASSSPGDYSVKAFDSGTTTSLTAVGMRAGILLYRTTYAWRVRYRDNGGAWSPWSDETTFTTGAVPSNRTPNTPANVSPTQGEIHVALPVTLRGSAFSDPNAGDWQGGSRWEVRATTSSAAFSTMVYDSGTTAGLTTSCVVPAGRLGYGYSYYWRVRYRDSSGTNSSWSTPTSFTVTPPPIAPNTPVNQFPADGAAQVPLPVTLRATPFSDPQAWDFQTAAQWEVRPTTSTAWSVLAYDSGTTTATNHCAVPAGALAGKTGYIWRTRYRDSSNTWSLWSTETPFTTATPPPAEWQVR